MIDLMHGDCLELMKQIPDKSVDMILCDLPYGTTACKWDSIIPFDKLWEQYKRIVKDNGAITLFGSEPFSTKLRASNLSMFRYDIVWDKTRGSNFANARKQPMKSHEIVSIFYKHLPTYNPQFWYAKPYKTTAKVRSKEIEGLGGAASQPSARLQSVRTEGAILYPLYHSPEMGAEYTPHKSP